MKFLLQKTVLVLACVGVATSVAFAADAPHWTYDEQDIWAEIPSTLTPAGLPPYEECGLGQKQSPVDLGAAKLVTTTNLLQTRYKAEPLVISNNGHTVKMNTKAGNIIFTRQVNTLSMAKRIPWKFILSTEHQTESWRC